MIIESIGTALPERSLPQATTAAWAQEVSGRNGHARLIPLLYRRAGIRRRHSVVLEGDPVRQTFFAPGATGPTTGRRMQRYAEEASRLAVRAAEAALGARRDVTHLVTVSCSGFAAPGFDVALVKELGLPPTTPRTHVGFMGCHGALNGLRVARAFAAADPAARVLLCAVELCSLHYDYADTASSHVANSLFADGAAALVASRGDRPWRLADSAACLLPDSEALMGWTIGDHGFRMTLSAEVPARIERDLPPFLAGWLGRHGLAVGDVATWAVHPGGPRILGGVERALGLGPDALAESRAVLAECGNMSSPTLLFILDRLRRSGAPLPCVALGFGPGLTAEAALFA